MSLSLAADAAEKGSLTQSQTPQACDSGIAIDPGTDVVSDDPADPQNMPTWRKLLILFIVSFSAASVNYGAAAHIIAIVPVAKYYHVSIPASADSLGLTILGTGIGPLFYGPLSKTVGRRPTYILSATLYFATMFWPAFTKSFASFYASRFVIGFLGAAPLTLGATTASDIFSKEHRGFAVAFWSLFVAGGPVTAPVIGGFMLEHLRWQWLYYFGIILAAASLVLIVLFVPETLYTRRMTSSGSTGEGADLSPVTYTGKLGAVWMPWHRPKTFLMMTLRPLVMFTYLPILLPSVWYSLVFGWSVGVNVAIPLVFAEPPYAFKSSMVGLLFLSALIGGVIGKIGGGVMADSLVARLVRRNGGIREPEYRMWFLLPILPFLAAGLLMFGVGVAKRLEWPVPIVGLAIYWVGSVAAAGVVQTYIVDTYVSESMNGVAIFNFVKCAFAFAVPYFYVEWADKDGYIASLVTQTVLNVVLGFSLFIGLVYGGKRLRAAQGEFCLFLLSPCPFSLPDHQLVLCDESSLV